MLNLGDFKQQIAGLPDDLAIELKTGTSNSTELLGLYVEATLVGSLTDGRLEPSRVILTYA